MAGLRMLSFGGGAINNAFSTIQPDAGTSPVASGPSTLTLTSTDGSILITGTAATKTVNFTAVGGSIGGFTAGSVIFASATGKLNQNNSNFFWDDTNTTLKLGSGTATFSAGVNIALQTVSAAGNTYYQGIIAQNTSAGTTASTDFVLNADNATDTTNYLDVGINSSTNADASYTLFAAGDGYIYNQTGGLNIGTAGAQPLKFFTGGTLSANERMRITSTGNVGIQTTNPQAAFDNRGKTLLGGKTVGYANADLTTRGPISVGLFGGSATQSGYGASIGGSTSDYGVFGFNVGFGTGTSRTYMVNDSAGWFEVGAGGSIAYLNAASGIAGNAITGTNRLSIGSNGTVGVNIATATGQLHVVSGTGGRIPLIIKGAASQSASMVSFQDSSSTEFMTITATGLTQFPDGSAASPSIALYNSPATGFYKSNTNEVSLSVNGVQKYIMSGSSFKVINANMYFKNNFGFLIADNGGTDRDMFYADTSNNLIFGATGFAWNSIQFCFGSATPVIKFANALVTLSNGANIAFGTTSGTQIGTGTTQKLSFWGATPIVQPATGGAASTFVANTSLIANDTATWDGYTIGNVVKALRNMGILA